MTTYYASVEPNEDNGFYPTSSQRNTTKFSYTGPNNMTDAQMRVDFNDRFYPLSIPEANKNCDSFLSARALIAASAGGSMKTMRVFTKNGELLYEYKLHSDGITSWIT